MEWKALIDGEWTDAASKEKSTLKDPSTGEVLGTVPKCGVDDARRAIDAAREAFDKGVWSSTKPKERAKVLHKAAALLSERQGDLSLLETRNAGKPIRQSTYFDLALAVHHLEYFGGLAAHLTPKRIRQPDMEGSYGTILREPMGVVAGICPWNLPLLMAVWKAGPALAAGNAVILKPASTTPLTTLELGRALLDAGLPKNALQVITGPGEAIGTLLSSDPKIDKVSFTGSTEVGKEVLLKAAPTVKRTTMELGGKSANILLEDADLDRAIDGSLFGIFLHAGQLCESGSRLLVPRATQDDVLRRLVARAREMRLGITTSYDTDIGPLISGSHRDRVEEYIRSGREQGAHVETGGKRPDHPELKHGFYEEPTIFSGVTPDMKIAQEEIFGPVLAVIPYDSVDEAVEIANGTIFGLAGAVWSRNLRKATQVAKQLRTGTVWINEYHMLSSHAPRGGYKQSGIGRELGEEALLEFTETKHLYYDEEGVLTPLARGLILPPKE